MLAQSSLEHNSGDKGLRPSQRESKPPTITAQHPGWQEGDRPCARGRQWEEPTHQGWSCSKQRAREIKAGSRERLKWDGLGQTHHYFDT